MEKDVMTEAEAEEMEKDMKVELKPLDQEPLDQALVGAS